MTYVENYFCETSSGELNRSKLLRRKYQRSLESIIIVLNKISIREMIPVTADMVAF